MKGTTTGLSLFVCGLAIAGASSAADPIVTGQWDFDHGDLRATVGADLEFVGDTAAITTFPELNIDGQAAVAMAFGSNSIRQGFYMRHGAKPNGGGHFVNQYTLLMDIMFPASGELCSKPIRSIMMGLMLSLLWGTTPQSRTPAASAPKANSTGHWRLERGTASRSPST